VDSEIRRDWCTGREVRARVLAPEIRESSDGSFTIAGYASTTDDPYEVNDWLGSYQETLARGAFSKALKENDDVRLLVNHDGVPLARTKSGTLQLREISKPKDDPQGRGQTGLWQEASLDAASPLAQTVRSAMERGDMAEMSFAFQATRQEWNEDYTERTIREVKLFDVSVVTYPANPGTSVSLNSARVADLVTRAQSHKTISDPGDLDMIASLASLLDARAVADADVTEPASDGDPTEASARRERYLAFLRETSIK
jgi:HK97 family phage prohead protease